MCCENCRRSRSSRGPHVLFSSRILLDLIAMAAWMFSTADLASGAEAVQEALPIILPHPKQLQPLGGVWELQERCAIVLGSRASEPEQYAAEMLQSDVKKRFNYSLVVKKEDEDLTGHSELILLGTSESSERLKRLFLKANLTFSADAEGSDAFVIKTLEEGDKRIVLIAGSAPRGVIYGQFGFFQLLKEDGGKVTFPTVLVRDHASVLWRGRHCHDYRHFLEPGVLDAYMRARDNFIDVRGESPWRFHGYSGWPVTREFSEKELEQLKEVIRQAHRRGLFIYGTIKSGLSNEGEIKQLLRLGEELVGYGIDGLWFSFDDAGAGKMPGEVLKAGLAFGAQHGMTGRKIAIVPASGHYDKVESSFNREMAAIQGMEKATWFLTRIPSAEDAAKAKEIGLQTLRAWWHNWPRTEEGFARKDYEGLPRSEEYHPYRQIPALTEAERWARPYRTFTYDMVRDAGTQISAVSFYGIFYGDEYLATIMGFWAWDPKTFDQKETARYIYDVVFGKPLVEVAEGFDSDLAVLEGTFERSRRQTGPLPRVLKTEQDRPKVEQRIDDMTSRLEKLKSDSPRLSLLSESRLKRMYLQPMEIELSAIRTGLALTPIDAEIQEDEKGIVLALLDGKAEEALKGIEEYQKDLARAEQVQETLDFLPPTAWPNHVLVSYCKGSTEELQKTHAFLKEYFEKHPGEKIRDWQILFKAKTSWQVVPTPIIDAAAGHLLPQDFEGFCQTFKGFNQQEEFKGFDQVIRKAARGRLGKDWTEERQKKLEDALGNAPGPEKQ